MARNSKAGATSCHTIKAKASCLQHNRREQEAGNVYKALTPNNTTWECDDIKEYKWLTSLERKARKEYEVKVGQKCQRTFAPLKETVVVIKPTTTIDELKSLAEKMENKHGVKCLGIWIHVDEGYRRIKIIDGTDKMKINYHAHVLWDFQNHETGKAIPLKRDSFREMQDMAAEALSMERGNPAEVTNKEHKVSYRYREEAQIMRIHELEGEVANQSKALAAAKETAIQTRQAVADLFGKSKRKRQIKDFKADIKELHTQVEALSLSLDENRSESLKLSQTNKDQESELRELRAFKENNQDTSNTIEQLKKEVRATNLGYVRLNNTNTDLRNQLFLKDTTINQNNAIITQLRKKNIELTTSIDSKDKDLKQLPILISENRRLNSLVSLLRYSIEAVRKIVEAVVYPGQGNAFYFLRATYTNGRCETCRITEDEFKLAKNMGVTKELAWSKFGDLTKEIERDRGMSR